ncbi:MAG: bifunctional (p)ppGpp synthetase/guanosine-3',5'-bis(diphosphate) 3'-pyrophosphohydrolase, partial [Xanthobacteraceae bacterium]|nr:bifunctional (p)ppGpp synthetase/guanosine-3',5'-bis(diphosphate) 3'-pyrophosphohydrolase [Xanthobacteraceae bacterium]
GRLIALPRKATPIDFAYAVHTDVGNSAIGCKINGQVAPLVSELQTGDEVEIIRGDAKAPPAAWDAIVITGKARAAIRRATRSAVRAQYTGLGRRMVERAFAKASLPYSDEKLQAALPRLARHTGEDLFSSVGRGEIKPEDVLRAVDPEWRGERVTGVKTPKSEGGWFGLRRASSLKFRIPEEKGKEEKPSAIPIRGINGELPVRFAPNGGAVPGDRIVGILNPGEGITIYPIHSPALKEFDDQPERWLDVRWDVEDAEPQRFPAQIAVTAMNEPGSLAQIATVIGEHGGNIDNIRMDGKTADFHRMVIDVEVFDLKHLNAIIAQLRAKKIVSGAERVNG